MSGGTVQISVDNSEIWVLSTGFQCGKVTLVGRQRPALRVTARRTSRRFSECFEVGNRLGAPVGQGHPWLGRQLKRVQMDVQAPICIFISETDEGGSALIPPAFAGAPAVVQATREPYVW